MKSAYDEKSHLSAPTTMPRYPGRHEFFDEPKERVITDVVLSAGFAAIVALCVAMFVGLYCWSRHAPIFPPDGATGPAIEEAIPWSG